MWVLFTAYCENPKRTKAITRFCESQAHANMVDKAFKNNLNIKSGTLRIDYQNKMQKSAVIIDPLNISAEIGQMNSFYVDNKFSVSQTIRLPKFYNAQKTVLMEEYKNSFLHLDLQKWQLKKEIYPSSSAQGLLVKTGE